MTSRERNFALIGIVAGLAFAGLGFGLMKWRGARSEHQQPTMTQQPQAPAAAGDSMPGMSHPMPQTQGQAGTLATVQLTSEEQQQVGLEMTPARRQTLRREVVAVGKVEEAETQIATISARVGGRIDRLLVNFTGQSVSRGQAIALIYSPEVVVSGEEYKLALENRERLGASASPTAIQQASELVAASRRRLDLWGVTPQQIADISRAEQPRIHITIHSPASGIITERKVTEGQYVREGDVLYTLTDLSTVWVIAEVYEADLPQVRVGQGVEITTEALPGTTLRGQVNFVEPMLNQQTRTVPVRVQVSNPGMRLRPGMFTMAKIRSTGAGRVLTIPRSAVLHAGTRNIVYLAREGGMFEAREVQLGSPAEDRYPVLKGIQEGERVVSRGAFMLDSQTRITGGMTGLFGGSKEFERGSQAGATSANLKITFKTEPDPPKGAEENTFRVSVMDANGKPVTDAQVTVTLVMPAMPSMNMPEMRSAAELKWNGKEYEGRGTIQMAASWNVTIEVSRGGQLLGMQRASINAR